MIEVDRYAQAIEVTDFILLPALIISSILNILFITDVVEENVMKIGIIVVSLIILLVRNLINFVTIVKNKKMEHEIISIRNSIITIIFSIVWVLSFIICMFLK